MRYLEKTEFYNLSNEVQEQVKRIFAYGADECFITACGGGIMLVTETRPCLTPPLDYHIKQQIKTPFYSRYMDDITLFGRNKRHLHLALRSIIEYMEKLGLTIKPNWQIFRFDYIDKNGKRRGRDLDMLGYRFFRDKTILRKRNALAISRQARRIHKRGVISAQEAEGFLSRIGALRHCDSKNFYLKHVKPYVNIKKLKEVVRYESRKQLETQRGV